MGSVTCPGRSAVGAGVGVGAGAAAGGPAGGWFRTTPTCPSAQPTAIWSAALSSRPVMTGRDTARIFPARGSLTRARPTWSPHLPDAFDHGGETVHERSV